MHIIRAANIGAGKIFPLRGLSGLSGEHGKTLIENIPPNLPTTRKSP